MSRPWPSCSSAPPPTPSYAQGKIGVIDSQQVLEKSAEGKKVIARLQEAEKKNQAAVTALDDQIRQIQTKLNTQRLTLTDEAALQLQSDLERKTTERKRVAEDALASMQELSQRLFMKLQSELMPIVQALGQGKGLRHHLRRAEERGHLLESGDRHHRGSHQALRRRPRRPKNKPPARPSGC